MTDETPSGLVDAKLAWVEWHLDKDLNVWITIETIHGARSRPYAGKGSTFSKKQRARAAQLIERKRFTPEEHASFNAALGLGATHDVDARPSSFEGGGGSFAGGGASGGWESGDSGASSSSSGGGDGGGGSDD